MGEAGRARGERKDPVEPESIADCKARISKIVQEIRVIETQLSEKNKTHPNGRRYTNEQYHAWRRNALKALDSKLGQLSSLKRWQASYLSQLTAERIKVDTSDSESMLRACYVLHERMKEEVSVKDLEPKMIAVMDAVRNRVLGLDRME